MNRNDVEVDWGIFEPKQVQTAILSDMCTKKKR